MPLCPRCGHVFINRTIIIYQHISKDDNKSRDYTLNYDECPRCHVRFDSVSVPQPQIVKYADVDI